MSRVAAAESAKRQPLLTGTASPSQCGGAKIGSSVRRGSRMGETAGECAAVCCCCPCAMVHLLILAVFRLPRGLWRKMLLRKKKRRKSLEAAADERRRSDSIGGDEAEEEEEDGGNENDVVDWDNEVWDRFYGAGFWRSASQRNDE
ncbi:hypothetical protein SASPL_119389 [Salvia splendens]|uniref:Uncharacterized protein n=1 Tax=Salvia splendens TaxID=180675 RepID=A0A8X8ZUM8_SALSN|nr:uncharacterized protein LOC121741646 [Salvia splendens]KAG6417236.1 hypothetical protein SASPL_119389 [Salvia splendens]